MHDMTTGNIRQHIIRFSAPILAANLLQFMNTVVDRIWAGKFINAHALGAVGISASIFFIMLSISIGLAIASSIMISQYYGAKLPDKLKYVIGNSYLLVLLTGTVSILAIQLYIDPILRWVQTPPSLYQYARDYLVTLSYGFLFVVAFNLLTSFFRAIGNSMLPLYFLIISVSINAALDPVLMLGLGPFPRLELTGAALSTIIAQMIAFITGFIYVQKRLPAIAVNSHHFRPDKALITKIFGLAVPSMIRFGLLSGGITVIQAIINKFGPDAAAAYGAASNVDNLAFYPAMSIGMALSVIAGQNIGARQIERARHALHESIKLTFFIFCFIFTAAFFFPTIVLGIFFNESASAAINIGSVYLRVIAVPYFFIMSVIVILGLVQGAGDTMATLILSIINLWMVRVPLVYLLSAHIGINGVWYGLAIAYLIDFGTTYLYYKIGYWRKKAVV